MHGVNVRDRQGFQTQANDMFEVIKKSVSDRSRTLKPVVLFWGDVGEERIKQLHEGFTKSPQWHKFWFRDELRTNQILPFVGDAAMYLSRTISKNIVREITQQAIKQMGPLESIIHPPEGDRLHLVTHSWGTVILFDILFASRWEESVLDDETLEQIENIRRGFFGIGANEEEKSYGIPLASIHTMGSPISLFSLINVDGAKSFNLTPKLKEFLEARQQKKLKPLVWRNYAHPGDPIAYPLEGVMPLLLGGAGDLVDIKDIMSPSNWLWGAFGDTILPILNGGNAHGSYWTQKEIAQEIGKAIGSKSK
jgi:hypothetical protein